MEHRDTKKEHIGSFWFFHWVDHIEHIDNGERLAQQNLRQNRERLANLEEARRNLRVNSVNKEENHKKLADATSEKDLSDKKLQQIAQALEDARSKYQVAEAAFHKGLDDANVSSVESALLVEAVMKNVQNLTRTSSSEIANLRVLVSNFQDLDPDDFNDILLPALKIVAFSEGVLASTGRVTDDRHQLVLDCARASEIEF